MNEIVNNFLLARDRFMPELRFRHSGLFYNVCGPFTRNKKRIQKFKELDIKGIFIKSNQIVLSMAWLMEIYLKEQLPIKYYAIERLILFKKIDMMDIRRSSFNIFFVKRTLGDPVKNEIEWNEEPTEEFQRPYIRKFEKPKVHSSFIGSIWCADLANMQLLNRFD